MKKLKLEELEVQSFTTSIDSEDQKNIKGGYSLFCPSVIICDPDDTVGYPCGDTFDNCS